jgi:hypothetical protein
MRAEVFLHRLLPIVSTLAALGPGLQAVKMFRARDFARTFTQYGPLPQIHISFVDYLTLSLAIMLSVAGIMEIARHRLAAPIVLTITTLLWLYYIRASGKRSPVAYGSRPNSGEVLESHGKC